MLVLLVNPVAGKGLPLKLLGSVETLLQQRHRAYTVEKTEHAGHATALARQAVQNGCDGLVVLGGDGTLSEAIAGLQAPIPTVYIVPSGSGNDFARLLQLPKDPLEAFRLQLDGDPKTIDLARVNDRLYLNVLGTGFDIEVLRRTEKYKSSYPGSIAYLFGLIQAIKDFKPVEVKVTLDEETFTKPMTIAVVANGQYIGGGMRVSPDSDPSDGLLDFIYVDCVKRREILGLLPRFLPGTYVKLPIAHARRVKKIRIESKGMTLDIDGNLVPCDCADIEILPGILHIGG